MADLAPGTQLGGYRVATVLGRGGMGVVYLAQQLALDRRVALKIINADLSDDQEFRDRFAREAQLAAAIDHRHIIPVYDAGEADGRLYLSMRYVKGHDLRTVLQLEGPLAPARALGIAGAVADALDAAHAAGMVHRDVKPANVLIEDGPGPEADRVYLTDFGLTKRVTGSTPGITRTGIFVGTPDYAAPEQASGKTVDGRTDEYSLACVLHECLTGATPFPRDSDAQVLAAHLLEPPPAASSIRPGLPTSLDEVLARGMAKDPEARFPTCAALVSAAAGALGAAPPATVVAPPPAMPASAFPPPAPGTAPVPTGGFTTGDPTPGQPPTTVVGPRRPDDGRRRRRTWLIAALFAILLVGGVVGILLASGGSKPSASPSDSPAVSTTVPSTGPSPTGPSSTGPSPTGPSSTGPSPTSGGQSAALIAYANGVDQLLAESGQFRQRLVDAVNDATSGNPRDPNGDLSTVQDVISERISAVTTVRTWPVPNEAGAVNSLLETSFRDALADDQDYFALVKAFITHDEATARRVGAKLDRHRNDATDPDKDAFVRAYNALRAQAGLPPLPPGTAF